MPIIKKYDMSTINEVKMTSELVKRIQKEQRYSDYTSDNIMLIRTTDIFPSNRMIKTLADSSFITKSGNNFIHLAYYYELDFETLERLETYILYHRGTIHFTENGLVLSHLQGNFDNRPYIILEPLNDQLGKANFRNFAVQDTIIKGNVTLSDNALIIIKSENYETIKRNYPEIENFNVILYNGIPEEIKLKYINGNYSKVPFFDVNDQRAIVQKVLIDLNYTPELVGSHHIIDSPTSEKVRQVNLSLANKYGVLAETTHNHTAEYEEDFKKNILIEEIFDKALLNFILKSHNIDINSIFTNDEITNSTAFILVEMLGLDVIINDIENFNNTIEKMKELNLLPTSKELLNNNMLDIYNTYVQFLTSENKKSNSK